MFDSHYQCNKVCGLCEHEVFTKLIISVIRDTNTIEEHAGALVDLLKSCLLHDLKPTLKDQDPPHAKIASEVVSCIFLVSLAGHDANLIVSTFNLSRIIAKNRLCVWLAPSPCSCCTEATKS